MNTIAVPAEPRQQPLDSFVQQPTETPPVPSATVPVENPVKKPVAAKTVKHLPAPNLPNAKRYKRTSLEARAYAFIRTSLLNDKDVDLEKLRAYDQVYINQKLKEYKVDKLFPKAQRDDQALRDFRKLVKKCIRYLFQVPRDLPYRLDHCNVGSVYAGIGLFITKEITTDDLALDFKKFEKKNSELAWAKVTTRDHDSCFTNKWVEEGEELKRGQWWKPRWQDNDKDTVVEEGKLAYKANFLIYGRLMFANHDDRGHFMFAPFQPKTPIVAGHSITGTVTIEPQPVDKGRVLKVGDQLLIYYDDNMDFDGKRGFQFLPDSDGKEEDGDAVEWVEEGKVVVGEEAEWDVGVPEMVDDVKADSDFEFEEFGEESDVEVVLKKKRETKKKSPASNRKGVAKRCRSMV
ncbi:hypothetical protein QFC21_005592 [Naganishia friedmannii]|uniref:Uncharacterized protein n=1 Tax=Naganishia friedmannii TaxID=89922 RepID=A0ACC2V9B7_9TREE|nr:hypothetical protein QFC21_005592 [Naganishia friedmannii]